MATSYITTECKRYGCMKNLLACYANCRFSGRCDELRNEIIEKPEQATTDINAYLGERGMRLIQIQFPKRGLKFVETGKQASEARAGKSLLRVAAKDVSPGPASMPKEPRARPKRRLKNALKSVSKPLREERAEILKPKPQEPRKEASIKKPAASGKARKMKAGRRKATRKVESRKVIEQDKTMSEQLTDKEKGVKPKKISSNKRAAATASRNGRKQGKKFIILEGKSASLVDEQGLMVHIMSGSSPDARYFEVNEVEARVQIVSKK